MGKKKARAFARIITCLAATAAIALGTASPAFAGANEGAGSVDTSNISVTVPTTIPCTMMSDGTVVAPSGLSIVNSGDAVVVDACTADALGNAVDFTLDLGGTRALTRTGGKDAAPALGIDFPSGSKGVSLKVSKLDRKANAALMDKATNGGADMLKLGFKFSAKALQGNVSISGDTAIGSTLTANVSGAQDDAKLAYQWYREGEPPKGGIIFDSDAGGSAGFSLKKSDWVSVLVYPTGYTDDTSRVSIRDASGHELYSDLVDPQKGLSGGCNLPEGDYTFMYTYRGTKPMRCQVTANESSLGASMGVIPGATMQTYATGDADASHKVMCKVNDVSGRYTGTLTSNIILPYNPILQGSVNISKSGSSLRASASGCQSDASLFYQWHRKATTTDSFSLNIPMFASAQRTVSVGENASIIVSMMDSNLLRNGFTIEVTNGGERVYHETFTELRSVTVSLPAPSDGYVINIENTDPFEHTAYVQVISDVDTVVQNTTSSTYSLSSGERGTFYCIVTDSSGKYEGQLLSNNIVI